MGDAGVWSIELPSQEALNSTQPFCVDTLSFEQWLQFVMMAKFEEMIRLSLPLPSKCEIAPMAEEAFKGRSVGVVIDQIQLIDRLLSH